MNDKITVTWLTQDNWKGKQHYTKRKFIDPASPDALLSGQKVRIKFNRQWFPALVVTPWSKQKIDKKKPEQIKGESKVPSLSSVETYL